MTTIDYTLIEKLQRQARRERSREMHRLLRAAVTWVRSLFSGARIGAEPAPCC